MAVLVPDDKLEHLYNSEISSTNQNERALQLGLQTVTFALNGIHPETIKQLIDLY